MARGEATHTGRIDWAAGLASGTIVSLLVYVLFADPASTTGGMPVNNQSTGTPAAAATRIVITVGNEYVPPGRTVVAVNTDGSAEVTTVFEGEQQRATIKLRNSLVDSLFAEFGDGDRLKARESDRMGIPDEPRYAITVFSNGEELSSVWFWRSEVEKDPDLTRLMAELEKAISDNTQGEMAL